MICTFCTNEAIVKVYKKNNKIKYYCDLCYKVRDVAPFIRVENIIKDKTMIKEDKIIAKHVYKDRKLVACLPPNQDTYEDIEVQNDPINPSHYKSGGLEAIDIIEAFNLNFCLGNAIKYILRSGKKTESPFEDIKKAIWYLKRYIKE